MWICARETDRYLLLGADLKTFTANGCYEASTITGSVAENTIRIQDVSLSPPLFGR